MLKLLERNIESIENRLVLLAPNESAVPNFFRNVSDDRDEHDRLVRDMQEMRGGIYLKDGALQQDELREGRHETPEDNRSWHLLMLNKDHQVSACAWYMEHDSPTSIQQLRVRHSPLAELEGGRKLRNAVEGEMTRARKAAMSYAEVGGWAVAKHSCCTSEGLLLALAAYSLGRAFGGALGLTTATVRHGSSTILRRLGGSHLETTDGVALPAYYDPKYSCQMELLRFDSRSPNPKYSGLIERLTDRLSVVNVIAGQQSDAFGDTSFEQTAPQCAA